MTIRIPVSNPASSHADLVVQAINITNAFQGVDGRPPVMAAMFRLKPGEYGEAMVHSGQSICIFEVPSQPPANPVAQG